jgi:hypothetical protein
MHWRSAWNSNLIDHGHARSGAQSKSGGVVRDRGQANVRALLASLALVACGGEDPSSEPSEAPNTGPAAASSATIGPSDSGGQGPVRPSEAAIGLTPSAPPPISAPSAPEPSAPPRVDESAPALRPKCANEDSQVLLIGDSYINWPSHSLPANLAELSGQNWRLEAIGGTSLASGGIALLGVGFIPDQFDRAMAADPDAHTIVMDGGGNDVLLRDTAIAPNSCTRSGSSLDPGCQRVVSLAVDAANDLMVRAATQGIRDVVYFFYPHVPARTILTEDDPNEILDYSLPLSMALCEGAEERTGGALRCTFIDMVPVFDGHAEYFNEDIHPNQVGGRVMAEKVWEVMEEHCLGQKSDNDCCEP